MIDTTILLDWLLGRNTERAKQIDRLFARSKELHIPDIVIVELAFALEKFYGFPRDVLVARYILCAPHAVMS